ncbi:MAG TPA: NACHT domain-containing protein [Pseudonocardiaceae bacterium]|nr:NACHT domain-containing protein [Pseudonocardiaceae bacterium]
MGFVTDGVIDINEVYVPLQYERDGERQDVYDNIREFPCSVVLGPAGAGKSLLLKNSMLMWARRAQAGRPERVPVLIELHRCNGSTDTLIDLIVSELARSRVAMNRTNRLDLIRELVCQGMRNGALSLLFDGLDEVGRSDQQRVFKELRDLAQEYGECQLIVTCRDVVYQGQPLGPRFSHVVRVAEFDDAGVTRLLSNWRGLSDTAARAQLFASLRNNPALMRLARSPLLLTMIAYLHTEVLVKTGRALPTSRPVFYQEAISHLLSRDAHLGRGGITVYEVGDKLAILQGIALTSMESTSTAVDRLTISRTSLETTTKNLLPDLNLDLKHVKPLLDEIIDRSQLLVTVDNSRTQYVFRHLTLQEYLTAIELSDNPDELLQHYHADPLAWRETVKLWCGATTRDCTKVIAEIFSSPEQHHKILALECLAEAKRVDTGFASSVISYFLARLGSGDPDRIAVITAFGAVAADSRPRGQEVLRQLAELAQSNGPAKVDAMHALSASGRSEAAQVLAPRAEADEEGRAALRGMGELALPVLVARANEGYLWAVDDLAVVGTPAAAVALADLLWTDQPNATRAAWRLADLIRHPNVEAELRRTSPQQVGATASWMWQPFATGNNDPLLCIAGRVGLLLQYSAPDDVPSDIVTIDPRLAVPLAVTSVYLVDPLDAAAMDRIRGSLLWPRVGRQLLRRAFTEQATRNGPDQEGEELRQLIIAECKLSALQQRLVGLLSWPRQAILYGTLATEHRSSASGRIHYTDWLTVRAPQRSTKWLLWVFASAVVAAAGGIWITGITRAVMSVAGAWPLGWHWLSIAVLIGTGILILSVVLAFFDDKNITDVVIALLFFVTYPILGWMAMVTFGAALPLYVGLWMLCLAAGGMMCWAMARRRDRVNHNLFRRTLDAKVVRHGDRTSVIAP